MNIKPGDIVYRGDRRGEVIRLERHYGADGAVVWFERITVGDGTLPTWVPLALLRKDGEHG